MVEEVKDPEQTFPGEESGVYCNCWNTVKTLYYDEMPSTTFILNNLSQKIGDIAVFYYPKSNLYHYAKVTYTDGFLFVIDEGNYKHCKRTQRTLDVTYPNLIGFFNVK